MVSVQVGIRIAKSLLVLQLRVQDIQDPSWLLCLKRRLVYVYYASVLVRSGVQQYVACKLDIPICKRSIVSCIS